MAHFRKVACAIPVRVGANETTDPPRSSGKFRPEKTTSLQTPQSHVDVKAVSLRHYLPRVPDSSIITGRRKNVASIQTRRVSSTLHSLEGDLERGLSYEAPEARVKQESSEIHERYVDSGPFPHPETVAHGAEGGETL